VRHRFDGGDHSAEADAMILPLLSPGIINWRSSVDL